MSEPIVVPKEKHRAVIVGESQRCPVSEQEWIAASLNAGDRVRIIPKCKPSQTAPSEPYDAVVIASGFYDGVHLYVEEVRYAMTGDRQTVFPDFGDVIEPEREVRYA